MADPQDTAEALDDDKLADDPFRDPIESLGDYPPERPSGVDGAMSTPTMEAMGESVEDRDARTSPDPLAVEFDRAAASDDLQDRDLTGEDPVDLVPGDDGRPLGRVVDPMAAADDGLDVEADLVGELDLEVEALDDPDLSAEEAAMHLTPDPDFEAADSYLEE